MGKILLYHRKLKRVSVYYKALLRIKQYTCSSIGLYRGYSNVIHSYSLYGCMCVGLVFDRLPCSSYPFIYKICLSLYLELVGLWMGHVRL
jgi:hypothetical protein